MQYRDYLNANKIDSRMLGMSMQFSEIHTECIPIQNAVDVTKIKGNRLFYTNIFDNDEKYKLR